MPEMIKRPDARRRTPRPPRRRGASTRGSAPRDRFFRHIVDSMRNGVIAIRRDGTVAQMNDEAYRIFGLVRDAAEDPLAVECYRKALYLDPNHYETLLQMALLSEKCGDSTRARTFRQRAARTKPRSGITSEHARV